MCVLEAEPIRDLRRELCADTRREFVFVKPRNGETLYHYDELKVSFNNKCMSCVSLAVHYFS